jgi:hypothetical protein
VKEEEGVSLVSMAAVEVVDVPRKAAFAIASHTASTEAGTM